MEIPLDRSGPPRQGRQARFSPCLDFGFQYTLIRNNWFKKFGVEYWTLPGSNSPWRPCRLCVTCQEEFLRVFEKISYVTRSSTKVFLFCLYLSFSPRPWGTLFGKHQITYIKTLLQKVNIENKCEK